MKKLIDYVLAFVLTSSVLMMLLVTVSVIPRKAIEQSVLESAEYMVEDNDFFCAIPGICSTQIDRYADAILLSIAWYIDEKAPVPSMMRANYYRDRNKNMTQNLYDAITENLPANIQYLRYWHGSLIFVRPMLMFWNIRQIYIFHGIFMAVLFLALVAYLLHNKLKAEACALFVAMVMTNAVFTPFCLEYTWMYLVMLISALSVVRLALNKPDREWGFIFLIIGMITVFLDFFTTETLTLLIPLLLIMRIRQRKGLESSWTFIIKNSFVWGAGYVCMWAWKWITASMFFGQNVMPYVQNSIEVHLGGTESISGTELVIEGLKRNICNLFPFAFGKTGVIITIVLLLTFLALFTMRRVKLRSTVNRRIIVMYMAIGLVPYLRYFVIRHHSWYHHFFTYRTQATTIMALCIISVELFHWNRAGKFRSFLKFKRFIGHGELQDEKGIEINDPYAVFE